MDEQSTETKSSYAKRPLWQWILLYVVIGAIVYGVIYFGFLHRQNPYSMKPQASSSHVSQQVQNSVYKMTPKGKLGVVVTDVKGMTLYTYAKDTTGVSTCTGACLTNWPAYMASSPTGSLPANITVIKRPDGSLQYAWKGMPLYYFAKDSDAGDAYGNGVGGVWSVVK